MVFSDPKGAKPAERNAKAVTRLFERQQPSQTQPRRASSAHQPHRSQQATAADVVGRTLTSSAQPGWVDVRRRELLRDPTHDIPSHVSQQLELAVAMDNISPEDRANVLAYATSTHSRHAALAVGPSHTSCFGLQLEKSRHARELRRPPGASLHELYETEAEQRKAYHRQQAILRYEETLARRRAADPYVQLTAAQQSTSLRIPNSYTAQKLAERDGGRFVLDNAHRQHLRAGVPAMTRVMQGEYYYPTVITKGQNGLRRSLHDADGTTRRRSASASAQARRHHAGVLSERAGRTDYLAANKRHVRMASCVNREIHTRRSQSAKPVLACPCGV